MGHTHISTIEILRSFDNYNRQEKTELIHYLHGCCFSPIPRALLKAIENGNFLTRTGLNNEQLLKHIHTSI